MQPSKDKAFKLFNTTQSKGTLIIRSNYVELLPVGL